jgi:MFS family permease
MRWFMFTMVLANIAGNMFGMFLPIYLTELGATVGQVGLVFTLSSSVILVLQIVGGWISDSIGRLRAIAIGSIGGITGYTFMLLAPSWPWMVVAISVSGIAFALVSPSFGAFIAENSAEENRGRVYGIVDTVYQITGLVGPPLGGFLAGAYGFKTMLLCATLLYGFAAVLRIWMARTMRSAGESPQESLTFDSLKTSLRVLGGLLLGGGVVTWILVTDGVRDVAFRLSGELQPIYLEQIGGLTLTQIGSLGSIFSGAMMISPILSGRMADKYGERVPISIGFSMVFVGTAIFLQSADYLGFILAWAVFGLGVGLLSPAYMSLISKVVPQRRLGIFTGVFRGSIGFVSLPAPWAGAQLWERFSPRMPFYITAAVALVTIIPTWFKFKLPEKDDTEIEPVPDISDVKE